MCVCVCACVRVCLRACVCAWWARCAFGTCVFGTSSARVSAAGDVLLFQFRVKEAVWAYAQGLLEYKVLTDASKVGACAGDHGRA